MLTKSQILEALRKFINQRPGLEFGNYGDWSAYRSELRGITKDRKQAMELLRAIELRDSITADDMLKGFDAFSGRLQISETADGAARLEYTTGQYWPTEYRRAVCAVAASILWQWMREHCMPAPTKATQHGYDVELYDGISAGDYLRRSFRREFGRGIASRWFN